MFENHSFFDRFIALVLASTVDTGVGLVDLSDGLFTVNVEPCVNCG